MRFVERTAKSLGIDLRQPLSEGSICFLVAEHVRTHKVNGHLSMLSALSQWHQDQGFGELPRHRRFKEFQKGLQNMLAGVDAVERKCAFTEQHMLAFRATSNLSKFCDARDWAMCTMAWNGIMRESEYCDNALRCRHVAIRTTQPHGAKILVATVLISKTSSVPDNVYMAARGDDLCPVAATENYIRVATAQFGTRWRTESPFFFTSAPHVPLTCKLWSSILKLRIIGIGLDPTKYATHSLRRGGTTAMFRASIARDAIKRHGRWVSDAIDAYNDWDVDGRRSEPTRQLAAARPL